MDANQTELHATELLLQRGVRVRARAPLFLRLFGKKTITLTLRNPTGGALLRMGRWYLLCQLSAEKLEKISMENALLFQVKYSRCIYNALACLFLVGQWRTWFLMKPMSRYLMESLSAKDALGLLQLAILQGGLEDLMSITRLVKAKMITQPKLGHKTKRS